MQVLFIDVLEINHFTKVRFIFFTDPDNEFNKLLTTNLIKYRIEILLTFASLKCFFYVIENSPGKSGS